MKKTKLMIITVFSIMALSACNSNKVQPTFVPAGTSTPVPSTAATSTPIPTPRFITPLPTQPLADGSDFLEILRLLSPGTEVSIGNASAESVNRCFYVENPNAIEKALFKANGFSDSEIEKIQKLRVLYHGVNNKIYVGEVFAVDTLTADLLDSFKTEYDNGTIIINFNSVDIAGQPLIQNLNTKGLIGNNREYIYLYK